MVSATGLTSAIGIPQRTWRNPPRSIDSATVEYVSLEDGGDTTRGQNVKKPLPKQDRRADRPVDDPERIRDTRCHCRCEGSDDGDRRDVGEVEPLDAGQRRCSRRRRTTT
jgi:hypothetical protein